MGVGGLLGCWNVGWYVFHPISLLMVKGITIVLQFYIKGFAAMLRRQGREKRWPQKKKEFVWGNLRWIVISQRNICCSQEIRQTRCVTDASGSQKNIPPMPQGRQIGSRVDVDVWIRIGDGTLAPLVSVMIFS